MKRSLLISLCCLLLLTSCRHRPRTYDPALVNFNVEYNSFLDGVLYPSMVLSLANYTGPNQEDLVTIEVTSPANNAVLRVVIDSTELNYVTILQEVMPRKGERYKFSPSVKWKYEKLYALRQQRALDLTYTCFINDEEVDLKNIRLNCRSVNDCPLSIMDRKGQSHDFRWLFLGYVNENHPYIDSIMSTILTQGIVDSFSGYQRGSKMAEDQVRSIWYYALNRGITYSSISCTANPTRRSTTQHIRFFDEVYNSRQANCIDACVFFASIMHKIGIKTVILIEPCHAYLGYYADKNKKDLRLLETTITSWVNLPAMERTYANEEKLNADQHAKLVKYLTPAQVKKWDDGKMTMDELKHLLADALFKQASDYRKESYKDNKKLFADTTQNGYQMLQVDELRKMVQPISAMDIIP